MEFMKVSIHRCNSGEILAQNVLNHNGIVLISKDTKVNDFIKNKLLKLGELEVSIYTNSSERSLSQKDKSEEVKDDYVAVVNNLKSIISRLSSGNTVKYKEIMLLSQLVLDYTNESNIFIKYLNEIKQYDDYTYSHSLNTAFYCMLISKWLKLSEGEVKMAIEAGLLHDIGKTDIPKEILNKRGILTAGEFEIIKKHPTYGYDMVGKFHDSSAVPEEVKKAVLLHHERVDGSGYPFNTMAKDINFFARIVSVADVFDAMTSDRVYKKRSSPFDAFEMFKTVGVGIFDLDIMNIFINNIALYYTDMDVLLSDGRVGSIVYVPPQDISRPIIKISSKYLDLAKEDGIKVLRII